MRHLLPVPRLLPLTIAAMALLLVARSGEMVMAARGAEAAAHQAAKSEAGPEAKPEAGPESKAADTGAAPPLVAADKVAGEKPAAPAEQPVTESERALLADLRARREALDRREADLSARAATLSGIEAKLNSRFAELQQLQARLESLEAQRQSRDDTSWQGLVKVYEAMKPRDAATIFDDLDMPVLLAVLDRMKEAKAAPILAAMAPDRARQVTAELSRLRLSRNSVSPAAGAASKPAPGG